MFYLYQARDEDTLKKTWYLSPVGARAKSVEMLKHAQKRVEHMNMAARKKGASEQKKEKKPILIDTKKSKAIRDEDKVESPLSPTSGKGWAARSDDYSVEGVESRRNKLLFFSESWVLDDDHDHLLKLMEDASGRDSNTPAPSTSGDTMSEFDLDFILGRSSLRAKSVRISDGKAKESRHKDVGSWRQSDWDRKLAQEWHPEEDDEEVDITQLSAIKQADRMNARLRAQRHTQSLEERRQSMLSKDIAMWDGVLILDGRASKIHLAHLQPPLCGRIDRGPELGRLTGLLRINLSDNKLTGKIPGPALARLLNLSSLNLSRNQFTGRIPCVDLSHVHSLTDLRLNSNRLTGPLLSSICKCSKLKTLELSSNCLSGELPEQIGSLSHLLVLNLSRNQFTGE